MSVSVRTAGVSDSEIVRALFTEYVAAPHGEAQFHEYLAQQNFERELAELPGAYGPPLGALLLALHGDVVIGCVALKPLEPPAICEMKRLYVRPEARGLGAARALVAAVIEAARNAGYSVMRLDCMPSMLAAQRLYRELGFYEIAPYNDNPVDDALFFERRITVPDL